MTRAVPLALGVLLFSVTNSMATPISISFVPTSQTIFVGDTAVVDVRISGLGAGMPPTVGAYNLRVVYDAAIVDAEAPVFGTGLGDETLLESLTAYTLLSGEVEFAQVSLLDPLTLQARQPAQFLLATLLFTGVAPGTTTLAFRQLDVFDNFGMALAVTGGLGSITVLPPEIPEPGTAILLGTALLVILVVGRATRHGGRLWGRRMTGVVIVALAVVPAARGQELDDVADYAKRCFDRAGIADADLARLSKEYVCEAGTQLFTTDKGVIKDKSIKIAPGNLMPNPNAAAAPLPNCDRPAWLADGQRCYGNSYVQELPDFKAIKADLQAVLLCRHKLTTAMEDDPTKFRDVAMIVYNKSNGQTCWFQTRDGDGVTRDGTKVPAPHTVTDHTFWLKPSAAAGIECIHCHDNGVWMNSRWMNDKFNHPANTPPIMKDGLGPYKNEGFAFKDWFPAKRVAVKRDGLPDREGKSCTGCHRMHAKGIGKHGNAFESYEQWLDFSISETFPDFSNADPGQKPAIALWMPPSHGFADKTAWNKVYENHIKKLKACMEAAGTAGGSCKEHVAMLNTAPSPIAGARIEASLDGGLTWPHVAVLPAPGADPNDQPPVPLVVPDPPADPPSLTLRWHADSTFLYCSIEPSFPGGVTSSAGIGAQSYFGLPDSGYNTPVPFGTITAPGMYRIDMYCDPGVAASLTFVVSGQPTPYLTIQAIVNGSAGPLASNTPGPDSVTANARLVDPVFITWTAEQMQPNTCQVREFNPPDTPTGQTWAGDVGFEKIAWGGSEDQVYSLSCVGKDTKTYTVSTTVHAIPGTTCDVDGNLTIDRRDIDLILFARGQPAIPGDLRDADGDGIITVGDARICALRCTNPQCAPSPTGQP